MEYVKVIEKALKEARKAIIPLFGREEASKFLEYGEHGDPTYAIDRTAEDAIVRVIRDTFPKAYFVTEEAGMLGDEMSEITVLIDPIDGSTNATHGIPMFSSAIALAVGQYFEDIVASGVINLVHGDLFLCGNKGPVLMNGKQVKLSQNQDLESAYICMNSNVHSGEWIWKTGLQNLLSKIRYPRSLGSAALETAYVSDGRVDAYLDPKGTLRSFDCIPSIHMILKAGGFVELLNTKFENFNLRKKHRLGVVASGNIGLGEQILSILKEDIPSNEFPRS